MPRRGAAATTRRTVSAPARWPAERGRPREVAQRPLPSEMMATWRPGESAGEPGRGMEVSWVMGWCMSMVVSPPCILLCQLLCIAKCGRKKILRSALARGADQRLHVIKVALEGAPAGRRQAVLGLRQASIKRLRAVNVLSFFELARVHAEVAVSGLEQGFQLVEGERSEERRVGKECRSRWSPHH